MRGGRNLGRHTLAPPVSQLPATTSSPLPSEHHPPPAALAQYRTKPTPRRILWAAVGIFGVMAAGMLMAPQFFGSWLLMAVLVWLFAVLRHVRWLKRIVTLGAAESQEIKLCLAMGRVSEARSRAEVLRTVVRGAQQSETLVLQLQAAAMLRDGDARGAYDLVRALLVNGEYDVPPLPVHRASARSLVAFSAALLGELDAADEWLARAERDSSDTVPALTIAPRMVLALRRGEHEQAIANFDRDWRLADAVLAAPDRHMLTLLHAFAHSHAPGPHYRQRPALSGEGSLDYQGLAYLGQSWPEIAAFLDGHCLADESP